ncbi:MAG: sulfurtransferase [Casimicrobiaceae bacterium]
MKNHQHLIPAAELAAALDDPQLVIVDVRHDLGDHGLGLRLYNEGHIPGAHFLSVETDLAGPHTGKNGRHPLPPIAAFAATMSSLGVDATKQVIIYDSGTSTYSARLWWMLRWLGHRNVAVLDGGFRAWQAAALPLSTETPARKPATFIPAPGESPVPVDSLTRDRDDPDFTLIDARGADRFRGENETIDPVAGHIPGSRSRPFTTNLNKDQTFKDVATLRAELEQTLAGRNPEQIVHTCGSGVTACNNLLAMEYAGLTGSRLYPGSWSEWSSDRARPIEK